MDHARPQRALEQAGLARAVFVHQAAVDVQGLLVPGRGVPQGALEHLLGGAVEIGFPLARHQLLPFLGQSQDLLGLAVRVVLLRFA